MIAQAPWPSSAFAQGNLAASAPGNAVFKAADRLAIINLFGAYAQSYDAGKLDEFISLFADKVELKYMSGDKVVAEGLDQVTRGMTGRVKAFAAEKIQRRHALTSYVFTSQTNTQASGRLYFQVFASKEGGAPTVALTGFYEFTAVKEGNVWKFNRWIAYGDQPLE
jgi:hypothetical protein